MNDSIEILNPEDLYMEFNVKRKKQRVWITTSAGSEPIFEEIKVEPEVGKLQRSQNTLLKALIKANSWQRKIDKGRFENLAGLCKHYKINDSYASKIMSLNYLPPKMKELILDGKHPKTMCLQDLMEQGVKLVW